jgi:uncharacterized protein YqeY
MREALTVAMKERDRVAIAALRSTLAAVDNAGATDVSLAPTARSGTIAGAVVGLGASEVPRRNLTEEDVRGILQGAIDEREAAAAQYEALERQDDAERLRIEVGVLSELLDR